MEIVEALRPLWDSVPGWTIDPEPLLDLALSGAGPNHEFDHVIAISASPMAPLCSWTGGGAKSGATRPMGAF